MYLKLGKKRMAYGAKHTNEHFKVIIFMVTHFLSENHKNKPEAMAIEKDNQYKTLMGR